MQAKREASESAAKEAFFREALQELTLFRSRTSASLLQAQEQLQSASREAEAMEATYQTAWSTAQANHSKNTALLAQLSEVSHCLLFALHFDQHWSSLFLGTVQSTFDCLLRLTS